MRDKKREQLFTSWICDYIKYNFKDSRVDAFLYGVSIKDYYLFDWKELEVDLQREIFERLGLKFNIIFDKEGLQIRGTLIKC